MSKITVEFDIQGWEREVAVLEAEIAERQRAVDTLRRKIENAPLYVAGLSGSNGHGNGLRHEGPASHEVNVGDQVKPSDHGEAAVSLPSVIIEVLTARGRSMTALELREAVVEHGVPRERLGATYSYLYTVLGRLATRKLIQRSGDRYRLRESMPAANEQRN